MKIGKYLDPTAVGIGIAIFTVTSFIVFVFFAQVSFGDVLNIVVHNWSFWAIVALSCVFGVVQKIRHPDAFLWVEVPVQLITTSVVIFVMSALFYSASSDLVDTEIWNSYVTKAEYHEAWTERVRYDCNCRDTGCYECGDSKTSRKCGCHRVCDTCYRNDYHAPFYQFDVKGEGLRSCDKTTYKQFVRVWNNERKTILSHSGQISVGDGNMYSVSYNKVTIPASTEHKFVNYLKASRSIRKNSGIKDKYKKLIRDYPRISSCDYGNIELYRVINAGTLASSRWITELDEALDIELAAIGAKKQVNIIVYLVNTPDQYFVQALRDAWVDGKKNDVIVVIGSTSFPNIDFVSVLAWTKSELFKVTLRDRIYGEKTLADPIKVSSIIANQVGKPENNGGFKRVSMEEMEYLMSDIELSWWQHLLVVLVGLIVTWLTSWALINNDLSNVRNWRRF
jgi:hypothetical protein